MKESFEQELQESKTKAASELEALAKKGASELDAMMRKCSDEAALRAEADKKTKELKNELREINARFEHASKALAREEQLRTRMSVDIKSTAANMEKVMSTKEQQFSSELESLRKKVEEDTHKQLSLENDIAAKQLQLNELSAISAKQIQTLTQKLDEQAQAAKRLAQEVEEHKRAQEDAARENAEQAARIHALTEEKSLNLQTMKELVKENDDLEADVTELRARLERMGEEASAQVEDTTPAPAPVPEPPMPPAAPIHATQSTKMDTDFQTGLAAAAGNLKKAPAPTPKPKDARQEMLIAIQSQNITLKTVRKSMINNKPGDNDSNSIVGILARALIQRRKDVEEDEWE
eukprot:Phypoly_transcript_08412.p1 GENE.Phypoly_transcript_08412~~Phypoly_transcript_08412.p1  ORF type:complete len:350 (+),score=126.93 Phypoly_transcript_08412:220-1269(+)